MQFKISEFQKRSTYQEIADELTIPTEKMQLADISIAQLFKHTQQGSRFDDDIFLNLGNDYNNKIKEQQHRIDMTRYAETVGVNVANTMNMPKEPTSTQQSKTQMPTTKVTSGINVDVPLTPEYHDMTSGDRDDEEEKELQDAISKIKEADLRKKIMQPY